MKKKRIALLLLGVSSRNCGGAERFFSDFFAVYRSSANSAHELFFFTDPGTVEVLKSIGKLKDETGVVVLKNVSNRFKRFFENRNFQKELKRHRIDIIHVTNYGRNYFDRLDFIAKKKDADRPKIVVNIVDCEIPYVLTNASSPKYDGYRKRYLPLFNEIKPDAVFTWYELFCSFLRENDLLHANKMAESARTRFADTRGFAPAPKKEKHIVFAARLTPQKQPLMFAEAVRMVYASRPELLKGWKVSIYGNGELEENVRTFISQNQLSGVLEWMPATDLKPVLAASTCFVSTQDYENFPSLSMNEAMAAGNVIIARNVGQTSLFLEDGKNGYMATTDDAKGIADALVKFLADGPAHAAMMQHSLYLAREVHTPENFIRQIDEFWNKV